MLLHQHLFFLTVAATVTASAFNGTCLSSRECSRGSYCNLITSACVPLAGLGMACSADCHCTKGVCYGGICKECAADGDCTYPRYPGGYCDMSTWTCQIEVANGQACTKSNMCVSKHCYQGTCKATSEGEPCVTAADCEGRERYFCSPTSHTCIRGNRPNGEHCELNEQCLSGFCSNASCKAPDGSWGTACQKNSDCKSPLVCDTDVEGRKSCIHPGQQWVDQNSGCTASGSLCTSDSACCSKNCKLTQLLGLRECA